MSKRSFGLAAVGVVIALCLFSVAAVGAPLTSFDFNIVGIGLEAGPDYQAVPKGIATQVNTSIDTGDFDVDLIVSMFGVGPS